MGLPNQGANKSQKGTVSISTYKNGLRLRWRYENTRPALYISSSVTNYQRIAQLVKGIIERDLLINNYDESLERYHVFLDKASIHEATLEHQILSISYPLPKNGTNDPVKTVDFDGVDNFNQYLAAKGKAENNLSSYYYDARQMLKRWGAFQLEEVPRLLNSELVSNKTFNDRRNCLSKFFNWCAGNGGSPKIHFPKYLTRKETKPLINDGHLLIKKHKLLSKH